MKVRRARKRFSLALSIIGSCMLLSMVAHSAVSTEGGAASVVPSPSVAAADDLGSTDAAAARFAETCSGCHTIGGGVSRGPDLASVSSWPDSQVAAAVKSMERKVGPLSAEQVTALVALLKDSAVKERIAKAKAKFAQASDQPRERANSRLGGAIFFGYVALQNGGMPCSSCHRYRGEGGDLGPDLSTFAEHSELDVVAGTIARAAFPVMRGAYASHPITEQEARHLSAFMQQAKAKRYAAAFSVTALWGVGVGIGAFAVAVAFILTRPKGVRARLIQRSTKR